jgi:hypothetical protein
MTNKFIQSWRRRILSSASGQKKKGSYWLEGEFGLAQ